MRKNILSFAIVITLVLILGGGITLAQAGFWYLSGTNVRPNVATWGLRIPSLASCNTIDTDASGIMSCGSDAGADGNEITEWIREGTSLYASTTFLYWSVGTTSTSTLFRIDGNGYIEGDLQLTGTFTYASATNWDTAYATVNASSSNWDSAYHWGDHSSWIGSSNLVWLGTIGTGTWQGTAIADAYVPNTITIDLSASSTGLAADPTDCAAGQYPLGISSYGHAKSCTADDDVPEAADFTGLTPGSHLGSVTATGTIDLDTEISTKSVNIAFTNATTVASNRVDMYWSPGVDITITELHCISDGVMQFDFGIAAPASLVTSTQINGISCDTDSASTTSFTDATVLATQRVKGQVAEISSGTSTWAYFVYTIDE